MLRALIGAKELGLVTEWRFGFAGFGQRAASTPGVIYLDTGQDIAAGVLDHHAGGGEYDCTAELVAARREDVYNHLLADLLRRHLGGESFKGIRWTPTIITHRSPDWDGVVSAHLVIRLVEDGDLPDYAEALVQYTREVDQGRYRLDCSNPGARAAHLAYLALQNMRLSPVEQMRRGLELIERVVAQITAARKMAGCRRLSHGSHFHPGEPGATQWVEDEWFADLRKLLESDGEQFAREWAAGRRIEVELPTEQGDTVRVPAFVATREVTSVLNKYWVRGAGCPLFICPYEPGEEGHFRRVVISLDPEWEKDGRRPTLRGLGYALERLEKVHREQRNGGMDDRGGVARFRGGYCDNDDPWYDGRDFNYTIVDAPNSGTYIPFEAIVATATAHHFWEVPLHSGTVFLVWANNEKATVGGRSGGFKPQSEGLVEALKSFCNDSYERPAEIAGVEVPNFASVSASVREFPKGLGRVGSPAKPLCRPLLVVEVTARAGCSIEGLTSARQKVVDAMGELPDYSLTRAVPRTHFAGPSRAEVLLRELSEAGGRPAGELAEGEEVLLFNGRMLVLHKASDRHLSPREEQIDRKVLLYAAFLNEALAEFSRRITGLLKDAGGAVENVKAEEVCRDFLVFQTRYFQTEVSRVPRGRLLMENLAASLGLVENYAEVRSEMERLDQFERQLAVDRESRSERVLQGALFFVAVSGVYQTLLAYLTAPETVRESAKLWLSAVVVAVLALWLFVRSHRHRKRGRIWRGGSE
jgi:hypothetical protein